MLYPLGVLTEQSDQPCCRSAIRKELLLVKSPHFYVASSVGGHDYGLGEDDTFSVMSEAPSEVHSVASSSALRHHPNHHSHLHSGGGHYRGHPAAAPRGSSGSRLPALSPARLPAAKNAPQSGLVTNSFFFCFPFMKNHLFAWRANQ